MVITDDDDDDGVLHFGGVLKLKLMLVRVDA
jgi:hypothetical protein